MQFEATLTLEQTVAHLDPFCSLTGFDYKTTDFVSNSHFANAMEDSKEPTSLLQKESESSEDDLKKDVTTQTHNTDRYEFDMEKYPVREVEVLLPGCRDMVAFNPVVSLIGVSVLWGLSIWCMGKKSIHNSAYLKENEPENLTLLPCFAVCLRTQQLILKAPTSCSRNGAATLRSTSRGYSLGPALSSSSSFSLWPTSGGISSSGPRTNHLNLILAPTLP